MYATITAIMAPLLVAYGIPFIAAALLFHRMTAKALAPRVRLAAACAVAALGIAPAYDAYRAPKPIYTWLVDGRAIAPGFAIASFALTWLAVYAAARTFERLRARRLRAAA